MRRSRPFPYLPSLAPFLRLLEAVAEHRTEQPLRGGAEIHGVEAVLRGVLHEGAAFGESSHEVAFSQMLLA